MCEFCEHRSHKQTKCSGFTAAKLARSQWVCPVCLPNADAMRTERNLRSFSTLPFAGEPESDLPISRNCHGTQNPVNCFVPGAKAKKAEGLRFGHLNSRSVVDKMDDLKRITDDLLLDVVAVSESWLRQDHDHNLYQIPGYVMTAYNRRGGKKGGGVMLFIRTELNPEPFAPHGLNNAVGGCDVVLAKICLTPGGNGKKIIVGSIYKPPKVGPTERHAKRRRTHSRKCARSWP